MISGINNKFKYKSVKVSKEKGFEIVLDSGQALRHESLSSGEQHEIVLLYDLLFRVKPNTLVLIDEPELSLHVEWQVKFLPEMLDIAKTVSFSVLIATHSPYIVGDRDDLMVELSTEKNRT